MNTTTIINKAFQWLRRVPVTASISIMALVIAFMPNFGELLQYDRLAIEAGEVWRAVTCYLTHWNFDHLSWDLLMFVVLGAVCEIRSPRRMQACLLGGVVAVSAVVYLMFPAISVYRGLSGLDTALFALLATELLYEACCKKNSLQIIAIAGLLFAFSAKTIYEAFTGQTFFVDEQAAKFVPLVYDHIAGAVIGVAVSFFKLELLFRKPISLPH